MKPIIRVENVSKQYHIGAAEGAKKNLREAFTDLVRSPMKQFRKLGRPTTETIWALKDISFEVQPGDLLGFIGPNGAGKSTLLKILSRITEPTTGRVELYGRVGSLLEIGTGFHPELSGRENVYLNGAILGMKRNEITRKFDEIVAFSEIERFLDTPVKYYSSGMYMRLAFSVAAHLDPEILIVDEVLSVGDSAFQKKCLGKMSNVAKEGRTVLFVSHNAVALQSLCEQAVWLNKGEVVESGEVSRIVNGYFKSTLVSTKISEEVWDDPSEAPGNDIVRLRRIRVRPADDCRSEPLTMNSPFLIEIEYWNLLPNAELHMTLHLITEQEITAFTTGSRPDSHQENEGMRAGLFRSVCHVPGDLLNAGRHRFVLYVVQDHSHVIYDYRSAVSFEIVDRRERKGSWFGREAGVVSPSLRWTTSQLDAFSGNGDESEELSTASILTTNG
jgi:lipopolysaccharide transport system ATP-binding protein